MKYFTVIHAVDYNTGRAVIGKCKIESEDEIITNGDRIRNMTDEQLVKVLLCPYDTAGDSVDIMPCVKEGNIQELVDVEICNKCMINWLKKESNK